MSVLRSTYNPTPTENAQTRRDQSRPLFFPSPRPLSRLRSSLTKRNSTYTPPNQAQSKRPRQHPTPLPFPVTFVPSLTLRQNPIDRNRRDRYVSRLGNLLHLVDERINLGHGEVGESTGVQKEGTMGEFSSTRRTDGGRERDGGEERVENEPSSRRRWVLRTVLP